MVNAKLPTCLHQLQHSMQKKKKKLNEGKIQSKDISNHDQ